MKTFYDEDGNIVGTVEGFDNPEGVEVQIPGKVLQKVEIGLGHELEQFARDLEDERKPHISVKNHVFDGKKFKKIPDSVMQKRAQAIMKAREDAMVEREKILKKIKDTNLPPEERLETLIKHLNI